ncbi:MAG: hypothetical protein AAGA69_11420 [Pseudomonadota bacterium]
MSSTADRILEAIAKYDGKHTVALASSFATLSGENDFVATLLDLTLSDTARQREASSWMILQAARQGHNLTTTEYRNLEGVLDHCTDWPSQLHICQIIALSAPPEELCDSFVDWLTPLLSHGRPFLRAWSLSALARIASSCSRHRDTAKIALSEATEDKAASVRARARRLT